ncbi:MAG: hypothetical protein AM326_03415 [Candidatus Thorarchaeota archaeon SMTZ-45]|nr:MAG: hypothetical protein AM326_03415 [Candidatus Thorarchaeota archaeon SMTZ-45]
MVEAEVSLLASSPQVLAEAKREDLLDLLSHYKSMGNELIRRLVLEKNRIDILAKVVLGYEVKPFHLSMMQFQFRHPDSLQLAYRGCGKTSLCTVTKTIHYLLKDPNLRILLASKTTGNAKGFLKEIKTHFEKNALLEEIFGVYYDPHRVKKWDEYEIEVVPRTSTAREPSVFCIGVDGTLVSKHFDILIDDDLIDDENSRTEHMRAKTKTWYYKILDPCLEPPDNEVEHRGEHHRLGTLYHYEDLNNYLMKNELKNSFQVFVGVDAKGRCPWPEKHSPKWFEEKRKKSGAIIFAAQYLCSTEAMKGQVFHYDDCQVIDDRSLPAELRIFMGIDLATSEKDQNTNAQFAIVVIGVCNEGNIYVLSRYLRHIGFPKQIRKGIDYYERYDPIRAGVEANAYQLAFYQQMKDLDKDYRFVPIYTDKDKMTRALKLTPLFEGKKVFFRKDMDDLIDQFVLFPGYELRDGLDAFDMAYRASKIKKRKKPPREEPGLL